MIWVVTVFVATHDMNIRRVRNGHAIQNNLNPPNGVFLATKVVLLLLITASQEPDGRVIFLHLPENFRTHFQLVFCACVNLSLWFQDSMQEPIAGM